MPRTLRGNSEGLQAPTARATARRGAGPDTRRGRPRAWADTLFTYQGLLTDSQGDPLDGPADLVFTLYEQESSGVPLWSEAHPDQPVVDGEFSVLLGNATPLDASLFDAPELWLEVVVEGETLAPRQRITSVPLAARTRCQPGDFLGCYSGDPATLGVGTCTAGQRTCDPDGVWGACSGGTPPTAEVCGSGVDEDCDGAVDEDCAVCGNGVVEPGEACDPGLAGSCGAMCNDALSCTTDFVDDPNSCNPSCGHTVEAGSCLIDDSCRASGEPDPGAPCRVCDPSQSQTEWSNAPGGTPCPGGTCDGSGTCVSF